jgi:hypothetical protein
VRSHVVECRRPFCNDHEPGTGVQAALDDLADGFVTEP